MNPWQRHQLVWLTEAAWQGVRSRNWDTQAQAILRHWHGQQLPLVVSSQRQTPPHSISLGLPAPLQWERRRLALEVVEDGIARRGSFPLLVDTVLTHTHAAQLQDLLQHVAALQVPLQVYGSFGWQHISGMPCVRDSSDLDLLAHVPDLGLAGQLVWLLQGLKLPWRVDGELLFPNGWALAWREYAQLIGGKVEQVLVKQRSGAQMCNMVELRAALRSYVPPASSSQASAQQPDALAAPAAHAP